MASSGGQPGNKNAAKAKVWTLAIERALAERSRKDQVDALDALAEQLLLKCDEGDITALKELGDRLEGKPHQSVSADLNVRSASDIPDEELASIARGKPDA